MCIGGGCQQKGQSSRTAFVGCPVSTKMKQTALFSVDLSDSSIIEVSTVN